MFKNRMRRGELLVGTVITLPSTEIAEILSMAGFDWLFVDLEHSTLGIDDAQRILQAVAHRTPCLLRVPACDEVWIKKALDIGPSGIIVPQVRTPEDVERAIRFCRYPPQGARSVGIARAQGYGATFRQAIASANEETAVVIQIEHVDAVNRIEEILEVPGIDSLFIGPYDLSASMGRIGAVSDPDVLAAVSRVEARAKAAGMVLGIFGADVEAANGHIQNGYTLVAVGMDTLLIAGAANKVVAAWR